MGDQREKKLENTISGHISAKFVPLIHPSPPGFVGQYFIKLVTRIEYYYMY